MSYPYDQVFAADPATPENVASNGVVTIFAPGDPDRTPLTITTLDGLPLSNPMQVNDAGFGPAFMHATLDQVAWAGGGFMGLFVSYKGMKDEAVAARRAAEKSAENAQAPTDASVDRGIQRAGIPTLVAEAVSADSTVAQAASVAVGAAVGEAGLVSGGESIPTDVAVFAITDAEGRRSFLEMDATGHPTEHSAGLMAEATAPLLGDLLEGTMSPMEAGTGYAFAITDEEDKIVFGVRDDGSVTTTSGAPPEEKPPLQIVGYGTSMMFGSTGNGTTLLTAIASELGIPKSNLANMGRGGMLSPGIAARQGGAPAVLTVAGGQIPASGSVNVDAGPKHKGTFTYWSAGGAYPGKLAGVAGNITYPNLTATQEVPAVFTRTTPGDAVKLYGPRPFLPDSRQTHTGKPAILWIGRNNISDQGQVIADYRAMVGDIGHRNILILSELDGPGVDSLNDRLATEFPHYFVDLKAWLIANGLAVAGITPTINDTADIAAGLVPRSLMVDLTHLNASGYTASGKHIAGIIREKGWL